MQTISTNIPDSIRIGLANYLAAEKIKIVGSRFPLADYINAYKKENTVSKNQYTLVEFWFSGCAPCIRQFEQLKGVYKKYKKKGFEIMAISIDEQRSFENYYTILKRKKYPWKNILDKGGENSKVLSISKFPTSFLLNKKGEIIQIDITPESLAVFLAGKFDK